MQEKLQDLLSQEILLVWSELTEAIDALYDVDRLWNKGFGAWEIEYKYRRGGKTLCTLYAKKVAKIRREAQVKAASGRREAQVEAAAVARGAPIGNLILACL